MLGAPRESRVYPAIVIGSGFGGAVTARRLTERGVDVLIVERGRRWRDTEFPESHATPWREASWRSRLHPLTENGHPMLPDPRYPGLLERIRPDSTDFDMSRSDMDVTVASCYGGGSVVYGTMMIRPPAALFATIFGDRLRASALAGHFDTVRAEIGFGHPAGGAPKQFKSRFYRSSHVFDRQAREAGLGAHLLPVETAVDWGVIEREKGPVWKRSATVGEYVLGCRSGAKNSVDKGYLRRAEDTGRLHGALTTIVQSVRQVEGPGGARFEVHCTSIGDEGRSDDARVYRARHLFMCAGSMHTTRLLLEARERAFVRGLNEHLGRSWGDNGDALFRRLSVGELTGIHGLSGKQGGPCATSIFLGDRDDVRKSMRIVHTPGPDVAPYGLTQLGMTIPDQLGAMTWNAATGKAQLRPNPPGSGPSRVEVLLRDIDRANAGTTVGFGRRRSTFHPLGGCVLGHVTDLHGRVHGVPGLYVVDGSLVPGHTATCNPAWTIAALAEHCLAGITGADF